MQEPLDFPKVVKLRMKRDSFDENYLFYVGVVLVLEATLIAYRILIQCGYLPLLEAVLRKLLPFL